MSGPPYLLNVLAGSDRAALLLRRVLAQEPVRLSWSASGVLERGGGGEADLGGVPSGALATSGNVGPRAVRAGVKASAMSAAARACEHYAALDPTLPRPPSGAASVDQSQTVRTSLWGGPVYLTPDRDSGRLVPCSDLYAGAVAVVHNVFGVLENVLRAELHAHFDRAPPAVRGTADERVHVLLSLQLSGDGFTSHVRVRARPVAPSYRRRSR